MVYRFRERMKLVRPTRFDFYKFLPLLVFTLFYLLVVTVGVAPPLPIGGGDGG